MNECLNWELHITPDGLQMYFQNKENGEIMTQELHTTKFGNHVIEYNTMENKTTCNICSSQNMENIKN